jgi:lipoprotein-releasing system permease protein
VSFPFFVAYRYFRSGGIQTLLTTAVVGVGVMVYIVIGALFAGVEKVIADGVLGQISHITADRPEPPSIKSKGLVPRSFVVQAKNRDREHLDNWQKRLGQIQRIPGIKVATPVVTSSGFIRVGGRNRAVAIRGIDLTTNNLIINLQKYRKKGRIDLAGSTCLIGADLAELLSVDVGDQVILESGDAVQLKLFVGGVFKTKNLAINEGNVFVSIQNGQRLAKLTGEISAIETQINDYFAATEIAKKMRDITGLRCRPWTEGNGDLLGIFASQTATQIMIQVFALLSVAFGTASVLAVTVVQKAREIGILKAMGARTDSIIAIFLAFAFFVSVLGAIVGSVIAGGILFLVSLAPTDIDSGSLFTVSIEPAFFLQAWAAAIVVGLLSAISPARKASRMDPVEVIRYG